MSTVAIDPIAELEAAGEGRFEWAKGRLIKTAPPSSDHVRKSDFLSRVLHLYAEEKGLGEVFGDGLAQRVNPATARVPDVSFFRTENIDRVREKNSEGAADLIVEVISPGSRVRDRRDKFHEYAQAGVEEYWIVDPMRQEADFFRLVDGVYERNLPDAEGRVHSSTLPGFFLRVEWLWNRPTLKEAMRDLGLF